MYIQTMSQVRTANQKTDFEAYNIKSIFQHISYIIERIVKDYLLQTVDVPISIIFYHEFCLFKVLYQPHSKKINIYITFDIKSL